MGGVAETRGGTDEAVCHAEGLSCRQTCNNIIVVEGALVACSIAVDSFPAVIVYFAQAWSSSACAPRSCGSSGGWAASSAPERLIVGSPHGAWPACFSGETWWRKTLRTLSHSGTDLGRLRLGRRRLRLGRRRWGELLQVQAEASSNAEEYWMELAQDRKAWSNAEAEFVARVSRRTMDRVRGGRVT